VTRALSSFVSDLDTTNPREIRRRLVDVVRIGGFVGLATVSLGTNVVYARPVEEGRKGGKIIEPVRAKALRFNWRNAPPAVRARFRKRRRRR
jgi:hypothetical protein